MRPEHVIGTLDQQPTEVHVPSFGDAELSISLSRLAASWPQAKLATHIPVSLEALFVAQREPRFARESREDTYADDGPFHYPLLVFSKNGGAVYPRRCLWQDEGEQRRDHP